MHLQAISADPAFVRLEKGVYALACLAPDAEPTARAPRAVKVSNVPISHLKPWLVHSALLRSCLQSCRRISRIICRRHAAARERRVGRLHAAGWARWRGRYAAGPGPGAGGVPATRHGGGPATPRAARAGPTIFRLHGTTPLQTCSGHLDRVECCSSVSARRVITWQNSVCGTPYSAADQIHCRRPPLVVCQLTHPPHWIVTMPRGGRWSTSWP